jgi:chromosomal replication initiation ATPase DnaA
MNNVNISPYSAPGLKKEAAVILQNSFEKNQQNILNLVITVTGISKEQIIGDRGIEEVCEARFILCYFLFNYFKPNKSSIGRLINRDHATVIHALKKFNNYYATDERFRNKANEIKKIIES